jgi:hypothetical protein
MKTTVELPDRLVIAAKQKAAAQQRPLRELVEEGLRWVVETPATDKRPARRIRWVVAEGGVPAETANREAMHDWLERHT